MIARAGILFYRNAERLAKISIFSPCLVFVFKELLIPALLVRHLGRPIFRLKNLFPVAGREQKSVAFTTLYCGKGLPLPSIFSTLPHWEGPSGMGGSHLPDREAELSMVSIFLL